MSSRKTWTTHTPDETEAIGRDLAARLGPGAVVLLYGDLGAGKTVFVKGLGAGLGIDPRLITSPTFVLIQEHDGPLPLYHIDLYRLEPGPAVLELGLEEYFSGRGVTAVEWADRLAGSPLPPAIVVRMSDAGGDARTIEVEFPDKPHSGGPR